MAEMRGGQRRQ